MKKIFLMASLIVTLSVSIASASPYLKCDPQSGVEYYSVIEGDKTTKVAAEVDGSIKMDLGTISTGSHSITVAACNIWGCSEYVPFSYTRSAATTPANIKISN